MYKSKDVSPECPDCGSTLNPDGSGCHPYCSRIGATTDKFNPMRLRSEQDEYPFWLQCMIPCSCGGTRFMRLESADEIYACIRCGEYVRQEDCPL